jgi:hypothetical protein
MKNFQLPESGSTCKVSKIITILEYHSEARNARVMHKADMCV